MRKNVWHCDLNQGLAISDEYKIKKQVKSIFKIFLELQWNKKEKYWIVKLNKITTKPN